MQALTYNGVGQADAAFSGTVVGGTAMIAPCIGPKMFPNVRSCVAASPS